MHKDAIHRVTTNLPSELLDEACKTTGKGITETLVEGLQLIRRSRALEKAVSLKGKLRLDIDIDGSRERSRR